MTIVNPTQLVDEFKKSGEFDRLRRELLRQFQRSDGMSSFISRVEDIARQRLVSDQKLPYLPHDVAHRELMQEVDRYPIVERAVADVRMLSEPSFAARIQASAQRILKEDRAKAPLSVALPPNKDDGSDVKLGPTPDSAAGTGTQQEPLSHPMKITNSPPQNVFPLSSPRSATPVRNLVPEPQNETEKIGGADSQHT